MQRGRRLKMVIAGLIIVATACASEEPVPQRAFDREAYCDAQFERETIGAFESEDADERKRYAEDRLRPLTQAARDEAPEELVDEFEVFLDATSKMAETGDPADFGTQAAQDARKRIHAVDLDTCGWKRVQVTASEYEFGGLTPPPASGRSSIELSNDGKEPHEIVLYRVNEGVTDTIEELLALPEDEVTKKVTQVGAAFAEPGDEDYGIVDLDPGRYGAVCFIPVGGGDEGTPHFSKGMFHEFVVPR